MDTDESAPRSVHDSKAAPSAVSTSDGVLEPDGVEWALAVANRNFLIHQYDEIDRRLTWLTLSRDLPAWGESLQELFAAAQAAMHDSMG